MCKKYKQKKLIFFLKPGNEYDVPGLTERGMKCIFKSWQLTKYCHQGYSWVFQGGGGVLESPNPP